MLMPNKTKDEVGGGNGDKSSQAVCVAEPWIFFAGSQVIPSLKMKLRWASL